MYDVLSGKIFIDGYDVCDLKIDFFCDFVVVVF